MKGLDRDMKALELELEGICEFLTVRNFLNLS